MKDVHIAGLSILGGEPFEHPHELLTLVKRIKQECSGKNIWIWSGYTFEEILADEPKRTLLSYCDVLIDGKFVLEQRNLKLSWRGSENQRVLDVAASIKTGQGVWIEE
ncbi:anaerobic ribonucleotide reductase-activating protein [compost metagenome]